MLPDDWWTTGLEDEPCDGCGKKPSKHAGHGNYTCETCFNAWWCPECHYRLTVGHVCPTSEEQAANEKWWNEQVVLLDLD